MDKQPNAPLPTPPESPAPLGGRERLKERLQAKHPDKDFDDEDALLGQINDDYDEQEKELSGYKEREGQIAGLFSRDPRSASFLSNWSNGADPVVELVRLFGREIADAADDPEKLDQIAEANKQFLEREANSRQLEEEYNANLEESLKHLQSLQDEGTPDDQIDEAMTFLLEIVTNGVRGKFTPEMVQMALKAIGYDRAVTEAEETGRVAGRNEKIDVKLRKPQGGDGTADLAGGGAIQDRPTPNLGALDGASSRPSIWDKGEMKRIKRGE